MAATKFMFGTDFREGGRKAAGEADLAAARAEGFRAGQDEARREAQGQLAGLTAQLARSAERLVAQEAARGATIEEQAANVAIAAARALAGAALAQMPLAALAEAMREALSHARSAPHLVLRVHDSLVDAAEELTRTLAAEHGFAGKAIVLGQSDIAPGDGRIEWAEGGFVLDSRQIVALAEEALARVFGHDHAHHEGLTP
ncbi:FliH/SctL family protein [Bosea sp. (in: a-proteobacteria)]|uniref:FliH/SctL family protein n=1 Tax=Bosea sp. (in: a-proteobacteria) TaxID=1871050 RepID=UPI0026330449|nr:FliH/SctL family protein [Bosea sp. (in: a-proteobacteria)]MCO5091559.1 FliH/SctL family protein [Bosea sp. (in: a-proteobacteria)]